MAETDQVPELLPDIVPMTGPLPRPSNEAISSIILQAQVHYLQSKAAKLDTEIQGLRDQIAALRDENSFLRFENDVLLNNESTMRKPPADPSIEPDSRSSDLISLSPDTSLMCSPARTTYEGKDNTIQESRPGRGLVEVATARLLDFDDTENQTNHHFQPTTPQIEAKPSDRKENHHTLGDSGSWYHPVVIKDDEDVPAKQPLHPDEQSTALQQRTFNAANEDLYSAAEAHSQNTSLVLTNLPADTTYRSLMRAVAAIRPGRIKQVKVHAVNITFFTRDAAERFHGTFADKKSRLQGTPLDGVMASWSKNPVPPEDSSGHTRVLGVEGDLGFVTVPNVLAAMRSQGFDPEMESIGVMPPQTHPRNSSCMFGPLRQVMCRFWCVRDAERARELLARVLPREGRVVYEYLHDS